jgi:hypothetical protein
MPEIHPSQSIFNILYIIKKINLLTNFLLPAYFMVVDGISYESSLICSGQHAYKSV